MNTSDLALAALLATLAFYVGMGIRLSRINARLGRIEARKAARLG